MSAAEEVAVPLAPESGVRTVERTWLQRYIDRKFPPVDYTIHDATGRALATVTHAEQACDALHAIDAAETVRRVSDGALINTKYRIKAGSHVYAWAWRLTREPERDQ